MDHHFQWKEDVSDDNKEGIQVIPSLLLLRKLKLAIFSRIIKDMIKVK